MKAYPVENTEDFTKKAWGSMRFLLEEALRRTMMGVRSEKRTAYMKLAMSFNAMENQLLSTDEVEAYGLWVKCTEANLVKMVNEITENRTSLLQNPSVDEVFGWPGVGAEFLSLRNFEGEAVQPNLLSEEDYALLMED